MIAATALVMLVATPVATADVLKTKRFPYSGGPQSYIVPLGVTALRIDAFGAAGGSYQSQNDFGGLGGHTTAVVPVTPGETLQVNVGGQGLFYPDGNSYAGGWNGGGGVTAEGGTGGGASDVRRGGTALANRIVVAGGGGGIGGGETPRGAGGAAGGPTGVKGGTGSCGDEGGGGATPTQGGARGSVGPSYVGTGATSGTVGTGGTGGFGQGNYYYYYGGGGGGGGYYGGGGGKGGSGYLSPFSYCEGGGGGGGSSFVAPSVVSAANTPGVRAGDGLVEITPLDASVLAEVKEPAPGASDTCTSGTVVDSTQAGVHAMLRAQSNAATAGNAWVCFHVEGAGVAKGAWIDIAPSGGIGDPELNEPTVDGEHTRCENPPAGYSSNSAPGPHPFVDGFSGDPGAPNRVEWYADTYSGINPNGIGEAWVCFRVTTSAGTVGRRVVVSESPVETDEGAPPVVTVHPDTGTP